MVCSDAGKELVVKIGREQVSKNARKLLRFLSENKGKLSPLLILTHDYPDPDGLASAFALHYIAGKIFGIKASQIPLPGFVGIKRQLRDVAVRHRSDVLQFDAV